MQIDLTQNLQEVKSRLGDSYPRLAAPIRATLTSWIVIGGRQDPVALAIPVAVDIFRRGGDPTLFLAVAAEMALASEQN